MRSSNVERARSLVKNVSREDRAAVSRSRDNAGWTLLLAASYRGQTLFVKFFVDECDADIEQRCDFQAYLNSLGKHEILKHVHICSVPQLLAGCIQ